MDHENPPGAGRDRSEWSSWLLVQGPLTLSVMASGYLALALAAADLGSVVVPAVAGSAVTLWQQRPRTAGGDAGGDVGGDGGETATRRQDGVLLAIVTAAVVLDLLVVVLVPQTGRLPSWTVWVGVVLLVLHGLLLARAALAVRRRFVDPPPGYDDPPPPERSVEKRITWRTTPEPLRSLLVVVGLCLAGFLAVIPLGLLLPEDQAEPVFFVAVGALGVAFLLVGGCVALDVGGAAGAYALRLADLRRAQGRGAPGEPSHGRVLLARVTGAFFAATGVLLLWVATLP